MFQIYKITNKINKKSYIGSSCNVQRRWVQHKQASINEKNRHYMYPLMCAFRKYGLDNFLFEIIETVSTQEEMLLKEKEFIQKYNSIVPFGYNQTENTMAPTIDNKIIKKISDTKRNIYGKKVAEISSSSNQIIHIWKSIVDCAEETHLNRFKISSVCNGKRLTTGNRIFRFISENNEIIEPTICINSTNYNRITQNSQAVIAIQDGKIVKSFPSVALAAKEMNCDASGISKVCLGKRKTCGGYEWQYQK